MAMDDSAGAGGTGASRYVGMLAWVDGFDELGGGDGGISGG